MSKFTKEMVDDFADKLLIGLSEEEKTKFLAEFDIIEADMERIANMAEIKDIEPMTHALDDFSYTLREDVVKDSLPIEDITKNCEVYEDREISVPKVVG